MISKDQLVVTLRLDDAVDEMNVINRFLESRWKGTEMEVAEKSTIQIIAMGLLVSKWMERSPKVTQDAVTAAVKQLAKELHSTIDMAQG